MYVHIFFVKEGKKLLIQRAMKTQFETESENQSAEGYFLQGADKQAYCHHSECI